MNPCAFCTEPDLAVCKPCYESLHRGDKVSAIDTRPIELYDSNPPIASTVSNDASIPVRYATSSELKQMIEAQLAMANTLNSLVKRVDELERTRYPRASNDISNMLTASGYVMRPCGCYVLVGQEDHVCSTGLLFVPTPDQAAQLSSEELAAQGSAYSGGGGA